jgi:ERCC4-type nuclease
MSKYLLIDTREKPQAIETILKQINEAGVKYERTKLLFGDYMDWNRPHIVIDRKQNIAELAKNCTWEHERFKSELERARMANSRLVILVEQFEKLVEERILSAVFHIVVTNICKSAILVL